MTAKRGISLAVFCGLFLAMVVGFAGGNAFARGKDQVLVEVAEIGSEAELAALLKKRGCKRDRDFRLGRKFNRTYAIFPKKAGHILLAFSLNGENGQPGGLDPMPRIYQGTASKTAYVISLNVDDVNPAYKICIRKSDREPDCWIPRTNEPDAGTGQSPAFRLIRSK